MASIERAVAISALVVVHNYKGAPRSLRNGIKCGARFPNRTSYGTFSVELCGIEFLASMT